MVGKVKDMFVCVLMITLFGYVQYIDSFVRNLSILLNFGFPSNVIINFVFAQN